MEMDSKGLADLKEIQTTTKFIVNRLNKLTECREGCKCGSELQELMNEFRDTEVRISKLKTDVNALRNEESDEQKLKQIEDKIGELARSLQALQSGTSQPGIPVPRYSIEPAGDLSSVLAGLIPAVQNHVSSSESTLGTIGRVDGSPNHLPCETIVRIGIQTGDHRSTLKTPSSSANVPRQQSATAASEPINRPETRVIQQTHRDLVYDDFWKALSQKELKKASELTRDEESIRTVLCLDISESMASGNAWSQAKTFVNDFLNGLDMMTAQYGHFGLTREYVGVVTFGHETQLQQLPTSNYTLIRDKIDNLRLGGPSPLYGGLWLSVAGARSCRALAATGSGIIMSPRIIVITDGKPTETWLRAGPDLPTKTEETLMSLMRGLEEIEDKGTPVFFVGVGDFDEDLLKLVTASERRKKLFCHQDGRRLAKRNYLCTKASVFEDSSFSFMRSSSGLSMEDEEDIRDIQEVSMAHFRSKQEIETKVYAESKSDAYPVIGSRVRRGPDWIWDNQDHHGSGTVVGHSEDDFKVWVTWDFDNMTTVYRYGLGSYDVIVTDEPRALNPGHKMAVGCLVKPGRDARMLDAKWIDISFSTLGVVIRKNSPKAHVRWQNGKRGDYSYGKEGRYEIELCTTSQQQIGDFSSNTFAAGSTFRANNIKGDRNKNKNANV
ncbi:uncharacterized protein LOC127859558 [Dreissena polymorpha]|uniref:VWFA domain-containing protein n=1 Tax=Dreissena polymorpha TaxID=45954 RepID=A0A9D4S851_DREPO|nr:uncharacterized protein LOC127859558 [Dreissena polymorpha]KAH3893267.1 hypothetical protein DPMN_017413 [Dreissena polymorpha]